MNVDDTNISSFAVGVFHSDKIPLSKAPFKTHSRMVLSFDSTTALGGRFITVYIYMFGCKIWLEKIT